MGRAKQGKTVRGASLDIDSLFLASGFEPPKINLKKAIDRAIKTGKINNFSYSIAAEKLSLKNSNNITKWFQNQNLNFNTLKMIMFVLNCSIEDLVEPKKRSRNKKIAK